jgi:flagella basal body P-ring formation protein FlgA
MSRSGQLADLCAGACRRKRAIGHRARESVTIAVVGDGFAVSQPGEALDAGAVGDWIRVRTLRTGNNYSQNEAVRGRITRPGEVQVELHE